MCLNSNGDGKGAMSLFIAWKVRCSLSILQNWGYLTSHLLQDSNHGQPTAVARDLTTWNWFGFQGGYFMIINGKARLALILLAFSSFATVCFGLISNYLYVLVVVPFYF